MPNLGQEPSLPYAAVSYVYIKFRYYWEVVRQSFFLAGFPLKRGNTIYQLQGERDWSISETDSKIKSNIKQIFITYGKYFPLHFFYEEFYDGQSQAGRLVAFLAFHIKPLEYFVRIQP